MGKEIWFLRDEPGFYQKWVIIVFTLKSWKMAFIILVLYVENMLIASQSMVEISMLKAQLAKTFDMKDLVDT